MFHTVQSMNIQEKQASHFLEQDGNALAATDAGGAHAELLGRVLSQLVNQMRSNSKQREQNLH